MHTELDFPRRHDVVATRVLFGECFVDDGRSAQEKGRTLRLHEPVHDHAPKHQLERQKDQVDDDCGDLVREGVLLQQGKHRDRNNEEQRENQERDQLREGLVDVAAVAEAEARDLQGQPQNLACAHDDVQRVLLKHRKFVETGAPHQQRVQNVEGGVVPQQLLECEGAVHGDAEQAQAIVRNVVRIVVDLVAFYYLASFFRPQTYLSLIIISIIEVSHFNIVISVLISFNLGVGLAIRVLRPPTNSSRTLARDPRFVHLYSKLI